MANARSEAAKAAMQSPAMRKGMNELWRRIVFLFMALIVFRLGAHVPVPGINPERLAQMFEQNKDTILSLFNMFPVARWSGCPSLRWASCRIFLPPSSCN